MMCTAMVWPCFVELSVRAQIRTTDNLKIDLGSSRRYLVVITRKLWEMREKKMRRKGTGKIGKVTLNSARYT